MIIDERILIIDDYHKSLSPMMENQIINWFMITSPQNVSP